MTTPEGKLKTTVKAFLKTLDEIWFFMPVPMGYGIRGIPDFIICWRGRFFAIETKAYNLKSAPWQELVHKAIRAAGGVCERVNTIEEVHALFRSP